MCCLSSLHDDEKNSLGYIFFFWNCFFFLFFCFFQRLLSILQSFLRFLSTKKKDKTLQRDFKCTISYIATYRSRAHIHSFSVFHFAFTIIYYRLFHSLANGCYFFFFRFFFFYLFVCIFAFVFSFSWHICYRFLCNCLSDKCIFLRWNTIFVEHIARTSHILLMTIPI